MHATGELAKAEARRRSDADWEAVEREYRAGQLSTREIGRIHGVSHTAVSKRAKKEGWTQNLAARVREEVATRLVSNEVATANARQVVEEAATRVIALVREHRRDIGSARQLVATLVTELQEASENVGEIEAGINDETANDQGSNRRKMMLKAVSLSTRSSAIANLSVAMRNLVGLERQAFSLDNGAPTTDDAKADETDDAYRDLIAALDAIGRAKAGSHGSQG
jgi:hypothetical protein